MSYSIYKNKVLQDKRSEKLIFEPDGRLYYVYRITDLLREKEEHYYGSRISHKESVIEDFWNYRTSSKYNTILAENKENYKLKIIRTFDNPGDMIIYESFLHDYFDVKIHSKFWNKSNQLPWGFTTAGTKWDIDLPHFNIGKTQSIEANLKRSNSLKGRKNPMSKETKAKLSDINKGKKLSEVTKKKISENNAKFMLGKKHSDDTKSKMSQRAKNREKVECPYCKKIGSINGMKQWHFEKCKSK